MRNRRSDGAPAERDEALADKVHAAMRSLGWTVPLRAEDVLSAEADLAEHAPDLPEELRDAERVFERAGPRAEAARLVLPFPADADIDATLARAAREGGRLTGEIEEAMRRDREAAERERQDDQEDP